MYHAVFVVPCRYFLTFMLWLLILSLDPSAMFESEKGTDLKQLILRREKMFRVTMNTGSCQFSLNI